MKIKPVLIILILLPVLVYSINQQDSIPVKSQEKTYSPQDTSKFNEAKAYKLLYENQLNSNNSILNTIFYALSGIGAAMIFVFASNWWFNEKKVKGITKGIDSQITKGQDETIKQINEKFNSLSKEKNKEISDLKSSLQKDINQALTSISKDFSSFKETIRAEIKEDDRTTLANYQKQLDSFNENYKQQINSLNTMIETTSSSFSEKLNNKEQLLKQQIESEKNFRKSEINSLKQKIYRNEYWFWDTKGVPSNALRAQMNELEYKMQNKGDMTFFVDQILETSKKLNWYSEYDKNKLIDVLDKLPENYSQKVNEIKETLKNVPNN